MDSSRTEEFMRLFLSNQRRIFGLIVCLVPNLADADDILQDTSATLWQKFDEFKPGTDFAAWGLSVARLRVLKFHERTRAAGRVTFDDRVLNALAEEAALITPQADARLEALRACLAKLPERVRGLIEFRYSPGATLKTAAEQVHMSEVAAYKALNRAHLTLIECIQRNMGARG